MIDSIVDLSVDKTSFNFDPDSLKLCTKWEVHNAEEETVITFCNGNKDCCGFLGLLLTKSNWDDVYYSAFNKDGAGLKNIVSAQVIYYDVNLSSETPKAEIINSEWSNLPVKFSYGIISFDKVCVETCLLRLNESSYKLVFEV